MIDGFYRCMAGDDTAGLIDLYAPDALVIRFNGTSSGAAEIADFFADERRQHGEYKLRSVDQVIQSGDVLMWDALVDTSQGILETTEVLVLDGAGKIRRHVPGIRGYWGSI